MITPEIFSPYVEALGPFEDPPEVCVAVSGGADSLCLALLLQEWIQQKGGKLYAAIVDHQLREASTIEAKTTADLLEKQGIKATILPWKGPKPTTGIQRKARDARYRLLTDWCRHQQLRHLFLAHHADDQLETVMMRAACGSGGRGLAGMSSCVTREGIRFLRPLLPFSRECLQATVTARGVPWITDPSNQDLRFTRVHARHRCNTLSLKEKQAFWDEIHSYGLLRQSEERQATQWLMEKGQFFSTGYVLFPRRLFSQLPLSLQQVALRKLLRWVRGKEKFLKKKQITSLLQDLGGKNPLGGRTLNGCFLKSTGDRIFMCRENSKVTEEIRLTPHSPLDILWDNRFLLTLQKPLPTPLILKALGEKGGAILKKHIQTWDLPQLRSLPRQVLLSLPAFWEGNRVQEIPHLNLRFSLQNASFYGSSAIDRITQKVILVEEFADIFSLY